MLAPKKIVQKKLILYFFIMGTMLSGSAFLIYQNHKITAKKAPVLDIPAESSKTAQTSIETIPQELIEPTPTATTTPVKSEITTQPSVPTKSSKILDVSIFINPKFKALKEVIMQSVEISAGKKNPFESY